MRGVKMFQLESILDFIYHGEAKVKQEDLNGFLAVAEELKLKGLSNFKSSTEISSNVDMVPQTESEFVTYPSKVRKYDESSRDEQPSYEIVEKLYELPNTDYDECKDSIAVEDYLEAKYDW